MKCNECGNTFPAGSSCPDCGSDNVTQIAGGATIIAQDPNAGVAAMPDIGVDTTATKPIVGTVKLPDGRVVELSEGDVFTTAHESSSEPNVTFRITGDETVSGTPIRVVAENSKGSVTGGGGNGFALDFTLRFTPGEVVELPKDMASLTTLLSRGRLTATALKVGRATRFPLKF